MDKNTDIDKIEFTIFDTETTGLEFNSGDRIVELAAVRFKGEDKISLFESLINPGRPVSKEAFNVNKISAEMLLSAPSPKEVIPKFMDFIRGSCLCSYNAGFDLGFLNNELRLLGIDEIKDPFVVDILKMARRTISGLKCYPLWFVAQTLRIKIKQKHRALSDVELTREVFYSLQSIVKARINQPLKLENIINI
ncbi:MAG: 3'-5' exonuclease [Candidatus Omnitrophica bacterium]|nr:3'-5' exonuclease [Candidatus Omnitrophota bacterium]